MRNITMRTINIIVSLLAAFMATSSYAQMETSSKMETRDTRIGTLQFEKGYPSDSTVEKLYDEMDFQRATQAYIWALPAVASMNLAGTYQSSFDAKYGDLISLTTYEDLSSAITGNATTPYYFMAYDLNKLGPVVFKSLLVQRRDLSMIFGNGPWLTWVFPGFFRAKAASIWCWVRGRLLRLMLRATTLSNQRAI